MNVATAQGERAFICLSHSPFMTLPGRENDGIEYRAAVEKVRDFLAEFDPEVIVLFAPDHMNLLNEVRPPFTGILSGRTLAEFGIPELPLTVDGLAPSTFARIVENDVDLAVAEDVSVDHGMGLTLHQLFDEPSTVPIIPVIVNAIGFPLFPVARAARVGEVFGAALADRPERVVFIGTGGLSHNPPFPDPVPGATRFTPEQRAESLRTALDYVDPEWDRGVLDAIARGDAQSLARVRQEEIDPRGGGANEIRTWAAAWAAAGAPAAEFTSYEAVEPWITGMGVAFGRASASASV